VSETEGNQVKSESAQVADRQEDLLMLLALAKWAISVFKTAGFNHSPIPPLPNYLIAKSFGNTVTAQTGSRHAQRS